MTEVEAPSSSSAVLNFTTYDEFLNSKVTAADLSYLDDPETARQLAQLRLPRKSGAATRAEFEASRRKATEEALAAAQPKRLLASQGCDLSHSPLLQELAVREAAVRAGRSSTIIFIRDFNSGGQEVSGYIDYGQRLQQPEEMEMVFAGKQKLLPRRSDLSFFNWKCQSLSSQASPSFEVRNDDSGGLAFQHRLDRKTVFVDLSQPVNEGFRRLCIEDPAYQQIVLFDHDVRGR